jgi:glycosyltransferase involved in cell wall biosynthesis
VRILLLNTAPQRGGGVTASVDLATGLARRGHDVRVVAAEDGDLMARLSGDTDVPALALRHAGGPLAARSLARIIGDAKPDITLADRRTDVRLAVAARLVGPRTPIVHRYGAPNPLRRDPLVSLVWSRIEGMILNSERMRRTLERTHRFLFRRPVLVIPNGKDLSRFHPRPEMRAAARAELGIPRDAFVVSFHGILQARKNVDVLVRGAAAARSVRPVHLLIAGSGPEEGALRALAAELGVAATFAGFLRDLTPVLAAADAAANLSASEGFSNAVVEAMASGVPVIATGGTSHDEQVVHGEHGLLLDSPAAAEVAAAIETLAADEAMRARMSLAARRRAAAEFGLDRMVERYEDALAMLAARQRA